MTIFFLLLLGLLLASFSFLALYELRTKVGLAPLFMILAAVLFFSAYLGNKLGVEIVDDSTIELTSIVLFSGFLFAVLLIYINEGAKCTRALIIGSILSAVFMATLLPILQTTQYLGNSSAAFLDNAMFPSFKMLLFSSFIMAAELLLLVIIYQYIVQAFRSVPYYLVLILSIVSVLIFDALIYNLVSAKLSSLFTKSFTIEILFRSISGISYALILFFYLKIKNSDQTCLDFMRTQRKDVLSIFKSSPEILDINYEKSVLAQKPAFKIESALNHISDGFVTLDNDWRFTYANVKTGEFLRENPKDLIGKQIWTVFPDNEDLYFSKQYHKAKQTLKILTLEGYYERLDRWFENRIYPTEDGVTIYFRDITERKKRENSNQMLGSLIETSNQFIGLASLEGKPFYLNTNGRSLVGLGEKDELPNSISDFFSDDYKNETEEDHLTNLLSKGSWSGEVQFKNFKTDQLISVEISGFLITDTNTNEPISLGIVANDITERKRTEENLINSESLFKRLSSEAPSGIFQTDQKGYCNYVNEKWLQYAGITYDDAMGYGWAKAIHPEDRTRIEIEWQDYISSDREELETQFRFLHKNDIVVWVTVKTVATYDADQNLSGYIGMAIDVTERKQAEEKLINSELLFRSLTSKAPVGIFQTDANGSCSFVNNQWIKYSGISYDDAMGFGWSNALHPDDKERILKIWENAITKNEEYNVDLRFFNKKENKTYWLTVKSESLYDVNNNVTGFIGVCIDITERQIAIQQLRESEKYLDNILNNIGDPVFVKDDQSRIVLATDAFCSIFNIAKEKILGQTLAEYFPEDARHRFMQNDRMVLDTGLVNIQEETLNLDNKNTKSISTKKTRFIDSNGNKFIIGVIRDVTERKKVNSEIAEVKNKLEAAVRIGGIGYWSWDRVKDEVFWSDIIYDIYDVDKDTPLTYSTVFSRIHPEDRAFHNKIIKENASTGNTDPYEFRVLRRDKSIRYVISHMEVLKDEHGNLTRYQGTVMDITDRKKAELDLIDSEKLFKRLISNAPVAIFQADIEGKCNYVNNEWLAYTGQNFENVMGYGWLNKIHPEDQVATANLWEQGIKAKTDILLEFRLINPCGKTIWLSNKAIRTFDANNQFNGYIGISLDITDRKLAEENELKNKHYLNNILNNIGDPIFVKDDQSRLILVNNALCDVFGLPREQILGKTMAERIPQKERDTFLRIDKEVIETGIENTNEETVNLNGKELRTFSIKKTRYIQNGNRLLLGVLRDVTERKKAEEEIRKTHQRLTTHLNNSPLAVIEWDNNFKITNWSPQAKTVFGWHEEEVIGKNYKDLNLAFQDDKEIIETTYNELLSGTVNRNRSLNRNYTKHKIIIYCEWYNSVLLSPTGEIESFFSMVQDVTERIEIEKGIAESEEKFSKVFNSSLIGYSIVNTDQIRVDVNEAMATMLESTREHLIGKTMEGAMVDVLDESYYSQKERLFQKLMKNGYLHNETIDRTLVSGKKISILCSVEAIEIAGETHALFAVVDNTDKKITELELETYRNNLEELVALRTEEVNTKNIQLERMNKLFVGRELKMRELKEIVKELKNKYEK
ncbi:PAS domain S-box protein [uncultured Winogradskyella sp.]|uniref:PAS domain S-box protein n=1 Tax=uncultured Winogradskyella sp. TaxID=395353 RepID=UPI002605072A|nr:PAS domain S-box protein [uncultured Winogradskyella sp.]